MSKQLAFHVNLSVCVGCKACQVACQDKNNLPVGQRFRRIFEVTGGGWTQRGTFWEPNVFTYNMSLACMHCQEPLCLEVCPTGATFKREDGLVMINQAECIGCRYCEWACPYGARVFNEETRTMTKCTMCADLLANGEPAACVAACPMRALEIGELDELQAKYGSLTQVYPLPEADITQPSVVFTAHRDITLANATNAQLGGLGEA